jgi:N-methylhydantoinase B
MLITAGDVPVRPVINLLVENTRSPFHMVGDVKAMLGTLRAGETRLREIMARYGSGSVKAAAHYTLDLAERRMRKALLAVPDGDYEAEDALDDDGLVYEPLKLKVVVRVRGAEAEIDFSGTDRQPLGSLNSCWEEAGRCIIGPKMTLDPRHPMNAGAMRPFHVLLPAGSVVLALPPSSQSNHVDLGGVMPSLMMQAMSKAAPEAAAAPDAGVTGALLVHGMDTRPGREGMPFGSAFLFGEAWGGTQVCDGISFCFSPLYNVRTIVIEYAERENPLVVWEFGLVQDSAGAGRFRGGFSPSYTFEALGDSYVTPMLDRVRRPAYGAAGGGAGMTTYGFLVEKDEHGSPVSWNGILPADRMTKLYGIYDDEGRPDPVDGELGKGARYMTSKVAGYHLAPGDVLRVMAASPGGYGNPLERETDRVLADVANERISPAQAERAYGVVLEAGALRVDEEATAERRRELLAQQAAGDWEPPLSVCHPWPVTDAELAEIASAVAGAHLQTEAS